LRKETVFKENFVHNVEGCSACYRHFSFYVYEIFCGTFNILGTAASLDFVCDLMPYSYYLAFMD